MPTRETADQGTALLYTAGCAGYCTVTSVFELLFRLENLSRAETELHMCRGTLRNQEESMTKNERRSMLAKKLTNLHLPSLMCSLHGPPRYSA